MSFISAYVTKKTLQILPENLCNCWQGSSDYLSAVKVQLLSDHLFTLWCLKLDSSLDVTWLPVAVEETNVTGDLRLLFLNPAAPLLVSDLIIWLGSKRLLTPCCPGVLCLKLSLAHSPWPSSKHGSPTSIRALRS